MATSSAARRRKPAWYIPGDGFDVECPACGASSLEPCLGIEVHPEYGPYGIHFSRIDAAKQARAVQDGGQEKLLPAE